MLSKTTPNLLAYHDPGVWSLLMFWFLPGELNCLLILNALSNKLMFMLVTGISASLENMLIFPLFNKSKLQIWDAFLNAFLNVCQSDISTLHLISSPSASKRYTETVHLSGLSSIHKPTCSNSKNHYHHHN